jgi:ankyrin repeat protein
MTTTDPAVAERLDRLGELINNPVVQDRLPDGYYDGISGHLAEMAEGGVDAVSKDLLDNLLDLIDTYEGWVLQHANQSPAFAAARAGDRMAVEQALDDGLDIDATDAEGMTLLMLAATKGHADLAIALIGRGADVSATCEDQNNFDAMMMACGSGHVEVASLLLDHGGVDINARHAIDSSQGPIGNQTALSLAANRDHPDVCQLLIERGADMEIVADAGYTALMWALVNGASEEAAEILLDAGANPDPGTQPAANFSGALTTPLILAASNGLSRVACRLVGAKVALNATDSSGWTALKHASRNGHDDIVDALIEAGADLNQADEEGWTPLIAAASRAAWSTMQRLIDAGADVGHQGDGGATALREVVSRRLMRHNIVFLSRLAGRDLSPEHQDGYDTALAFAEKLLEAGADPDVTYDDDDGKKLIDEATEQGDEELCELLSRFGAQVSEDLGGDDDDDNNDAEDDALSDGDRLVQAAACVDIDAVTDLLQQGADVNHLDSDGDTALSYTVIKLCVGNPDADDTRDLLEQIDLLLSHGASVDVVGSRVSPLPMVARTGRLGLVKALLAAGADVNARLTEIDEDAGQDALEVARRAGHDDVVAALIGAQGG